MTPSTDARHLTSDEKTITLIMLTLIMLAEALSIATLVGNPAPIVRRLREWMGAEPQTGDLVVEMSTMHRGPKRERVGTVVAVTKGRDHYETVTEIIMLDPPCTAGNECRDVGCIHGQRWSNAYFIRVPATRAQLDAALNMPPMSGSGVDRNALVGLLDDFGVAVMHPSVNLHGDIVARGPNKTSTEMLDDVARALGWRTDWACGDSPITWDAALEEVTRLSESLKRVKGQRTNEATRRAEAEDLVLADEEVIVELRREVRALKSEGDARRRGEARGVRERSHARRDVADVEATLTLSSMAC